MSIADSTTLVNLALSRLGQKAITSLGGTDNISTLANRLYAPLRKKLLREHPWHFAVKNVILGHVVDADITITGATKANPVVITAAAHGFANDDIVSIREVGGMVELNGKKFTVANKTTNAFELKNTDGTAFTAYTSGGKVGKVTTVGKEFDYTNRYLLPSDFLRVLKIQGEPVSPSTSLDYRIQSGGTNLELHIDDDAVNIQYIADVTTTTAWDDTFVDVLAWLLASEMAFPITQSRTMAAEARQTYNDELTKAKGINAQGRGTPQQAQQDDILASRSLA